MTILRCVRCDGVFPACATCPECRGSGKMRLEECPMEIAVDAEAAIEAYEEKEQGNWPVAGGWLDQAQKAREAIAQVRSEIAEWKRKEE